MSKPVKEKLKYMQDKMAETCRKIEVIETQIKVFKRVYQIVRDSQSETTSLPSETKTYEAVGRMFIEVQVGEENNSVNMHVMELAFGIASLENDKMCLEETLKETENNIREMVQLRKEGDQGEKST